MLSLSGLFYFAPVTAQAANTHTWNDNTPPNISSWSGTGNTIILDLHPSGTLTVPPDVTVTIDGTADGGVSYLKINIGENATVIWEADFTRNDSRIVQIYGEGTFIMSSGKIATIGYAYYAVFVDNGSTFIMNGGTISATGTESSALDCGATAIITINGGLIDGKQYYPVTVNDGTVSAKENSLVGYGVYYAGGALVTVTADNAPAGQRFKEWTAQSGLITFDAAASATTTFTMPASAVEVTATYEDIPPEQPKEPNEPPQPPNGNGTNSGTQNGGTNGGGSTGGGTSGGKNPDMTPFFGVVPSPDPKPEQKPEPKDEQKDAPSDWAAAAVKKATELKLVPARLQGGWSANLTRADFCALAVKLYEYLDGKEITARGYFDDTDDINVQKLAGLGIVTGDGNGKFNPNGAFTREMALTLMCNMMTQLGHTFEPAEPSFADADAISPWAKAAIGALQKAGVVSGDGQYFNPTQVFTREMGVVTVMNFLESAE